MSNPSHMASTRCYLNHRYEASRAQFFRGFGFQAEAWETFAAALRERGQQNEVTLTKEAGFRPRYEVEGELAAPDSRRPQVRTVWQQDAGQVAPAAHHCVSSGITMIKEHDCVVLTSDIPAQGLQAGAWLGRVMACALQLLPRHSVQS